MYKVSTDSADEDGEVVGILRGCLEGRAFCVTFIPGESIHAAAEHANMEDKIHWI
jgi:hypothetical protein